MMNNVRNIKKYSPFNKQFSTYRYLYADNEARKNHLNDKLADLRKEKEGLESDLSAVKGAIRAASKIDSGNDNQITEEEQESYDQLTRNYPSFLDSEEEEENTSSVFNKIMQIKSYIKGEAMINKRSINKTVKEYSDLGSGSGSSKRSADESLSVGPSKRSAAESSSVAESSSAGPSKTGAAESSSVAESSSASKSSSTGSTTEYIDDIPYNPFDDIGTD